MAHSVTERQLSSVGLPKLAGHILVNQSVGNDAFVKMGVAFRRKDEASMMAEPKHAEDDKAHQRDESLCVRTDIP
ncbi:hypothetical protein [Bradyrhizobium lablabi]|uniref:hypothetical protein n=1 Tax=Bradyrhizobium lablabi TaxID=722472 RepID=UPI001BA6C28E|nr:hypothetical protein [Bradyrhizobium lablabi]MBR0694287.1 hypothetical protein [Bradyrhizobium lablabi]